MVRSRANAFDVVIAVWGAAFRQVFLDICVPNQLTPGNIGALPAGSRYRLFTSREDAPTLEASSALQRVNEMIPVDIVVMRELSSESRNRFNRLTACHRRALTEAAESQAGLIFLMADHLISEGAFAAALRRHAQGSRAVMCSGIRVNREAFVESLETRGGVRAVPSRELVAAAMPNLHAFTHTHMIHSERTSVLPIGVCWPVRTEGILARFCYLHPLLVDPLHREVLPDGTLDEHYIKRTCPVRDEVHVVDDSDELQIFEMSHAEAAFTETRPGRMSRWRAAQMVSRCDTHQQSYWMLPIRIHSGDLGPVWNTVEEKSARFADHSTRLWEASRWLTSRYLKVQARRVAKRYSKRRMQRSLDLLMHAAARRIHKFRKQVTRAGRRVLVR
jgi:hypothetical protein